MASRVGRYTIKLDGCAAIKGYAGVAGKKEGEGPLSESFDYIYEDSTCGEKTWEKAESRMQKDTLTRALTKANITSNTVDIIFAGDLLNQCIGSSYGLREFGIPFVGLFGACSTMAESLSLASLAVESGSANVAAALTSSHFCAAERQFRFPLEYGGQRAPTSQWTVTGCGAAILSHEGGGPFIKEITFGKMVDMGIKDINNMGAAMAPAAADTIKTYFDDTGADPEDFDLIVTGDLGFIGYNLTTELLEKENIKLKNYTDCGMLIYDRKAQDVHAGGSGCGCSALVLCSHILNNMKAGNFKDVLFIGTGALMNQTSVQQGESIPSVAHLVHISVNK
ncbi:MAG TPA: stage V sporulation protein AD [Ruminiclostridium sp.]|nr:stage V sporulation protein AD [Ruminiclostridium sp.]